MNLPNPVHSRYGSGFIEQYIRDHLILRTEAATNWTAPRFDRTGSVAR
jgi:hypothetical protein